MEGVTAIQVHDMVAAGSSSFYKRTIQVVVHVCRMMETRGFNSKVRSRSSTSGTDCRLKNA